jgi:hypothetical protein
MTMMSKVNVVKELSLALDGMSIERTGFEILNAKQTCNIWTVCVRNYKKESEYVSHEDEVSIATLVARLTDGYVSKAKFDLLSVQKLAGEGMFELSLTLKGEENEVEDGSGDEKQVEA